MIWNAPFALVGLAWLAVPLAVHLLVRTRARRVVFPGMRFVRPVRVAAVRLQRPTDASLLLVRLAIVAAAVLASAQPVLRTRGRVAAIQGRVVRAVITDTSASVPAEAASALADEAARGAFIAERFAGDDVPEALRRAVGWLTAAAPGRREIAIVSDFQRGALSDADVEAIPPAIGVRPMRAGAPVPTGTPRPIDGWRGARWTPSLRMDGAGTSVTWTRESAASPTPALTIHSAAADAVAASRAEQAARAFGVPAPDAVRPIDIWFAGAPAASGTDQASLVEFEQDQISSARPRQIGIRVTPWIAAAAMSLLSDPLPASAGAAIAPGERQGAFVVRTDVAASSAAAPSVIRAVLLAGSPPVADAELEPHALDDGVLARWRRDPAAPSASGNPDGDDGRWLWVLALTCLAAEGVLRRAADRREPVEAHANAA